MRTASPTSRTLVVRGGLLPADFINGRRHSSDIRKRRYTGARDTTFARVAREIIGFLSVTDTYIHNIHTYIHTYIQTISEMRRRISCLALRRSATNTVLTWRARFHTIGHVLTSLLTVLDLLKVCAESIVC